MEEDGKIKILYIGFGEWEGNYINISERVLDNLKIENPDVTPVILSLTTDFESSEAIITRQIHDLKPDYVILLGENQESEQAVMRYETRAINRRTAGDEDQSLIPVIKSESALIDTKDFSFFEESVEHLSDRVMLLSSDNPGTYVCNSSFYISSHEMLKMERGNCTFFIHIDDAPGDVNNEAELRESFVEIYIEALNNFTDRIVQHEQAKRIGVELQEKIEETTNRDSSSILLPTQQNMPTKSNNDNLPKR